MSLAVEMPLIGIQGNKVNLSSYQGQWIVVNYWATWCPPCIVEMPELQAFHDEHADKDAMVIGINVEHISKLQLQEFLENYFITYPIFVSKPTQQSELGLIPGLPTTFLVNPQGKVVARQVGPVTREMIEQFIQNRQSQ
jgi:thiol-disulfide isomerase/thioredoxin